MKKLLFSIVIPIYKSEKSLSLLYERIDKVFKNIDGDYELLLVEDSGGDGSWKIMKELREHNKKVKIIRFMKNFGQHNALMCGLSFASGDFIIAMDDDLQNPPEEIPKLIDAIKTNEFDVIYGIPKEKKHSSLKNVGSMIYKRFFSLIVQKPSTFKGSSFRIMKKSIVDNLLLFPTPNPFLGLLILKITENIGTIEVEHHKRIYGKSTYSMPKLINLSTNGILYQSMIPLRVVSFFGFLCFFLSFILGIFYLMKFLSGSITVTGWTTIVLLILFFSGIIMFSIGILGEYLLRIVQEVYRFPQYVIKDKEI